MCIVCARTKQPVGIALLITCLSVRLSGSSFYYQETCLSNSRHVLFNSRKNCDMLLHFQKYMIFCHLQKQSNTF